MSSTLQEPALLQLLLPKPRCSAGLGKPLDVYADNLVFPRGCTPPGAPGSQHHCLFYDRTRGCPHHTALPVEHHIYTSTGSYSSFISKISSVLSLNNFFPCLLPCQVFISLHIKKHPQAYPSSYSSSESTPSLIASFTDLTSTLPVTV